MSPLEDKHGVPWTARAGIVPMILFVLVTLGIGPVLLAIYLALWTGRRRGTWLPLACFLSFCAITYISTFVIKHAVLSGIMDALILLSPLLWIGGNFLIREEILKDAREHGIERHISPPLTFFFSSLYLNFCLNPANSNADRRTLAPLKLTDPA